MTPCWPPLPEAESELAVRSYYRWAEVIRA